MFFLRHCAIGHQEKRMSINLLFYQMCPLSKENEKKVLCRIFQG
jgi:hypothetical protein